MLSLNGGGSNRLPPRAKLSFQNSASVYWRCFKTPTALMTMILASLNFLPLYTSLKVEEVAPLEMGTIGPMGDMTFAGFLTTALKLHLMKAR